MESLFSRASTRVLCSTDHPRIAVCQWRSEMDVVLANGIVVHNKVRVLSTLECI